MTSNWKTIAVGLLIVSAPVLLFIPDAAGQMVQPLQGGRTQTGKTSPGMMQSGMAMQGRPGAKSNETYCIVEVGKDLQIVSKPSGLKDLKKRLDDEYKAADKAYKDAQKDKSKKDPNLPKPEKPEKKTVKEIKSGIKTQEKAQEELQKLLDDRDKNGDKKSKR